MLFDSYLLFGLYEYGMYDFICCMVEICHVMCVDCLVCVLSFAFGVVSLVWGCLLWCCGVRGVCYRYD